MSNTNKLPTPEEFIEKYLRGDRVKDDTIRVIDEDKAIKALSKYSRLLIKYTLEQAHLKSQIRITMEGEEPDIRDSYNDGTISVEVDSESILSLKSQIIKDLEL